MKFRAVLVCAKLHLLRQQPQGKIGYCVFLLRKGTVDIESVVRNANHVHNLCAVSHHRTEHGFLPSSPNHRSIPQV